jgi:hypothetical protein
MGFFSARPHFEDRQVVQRMGELVNLSGQTNFDLGGYNSYIYDSYEDFLNGVSGATFLSLPFSAATDPISGWSNQTIFQPGIVRITPPHAVFFSGNTNVITGTTQIDVTNYIATSLDSKGTIVWRPYGDTGSTLVPLIFNQSTTEPNTGIQPSFGSNTLSSGSTYSSVLGGKQNTINSQYSTIGGGWINFVNGNYSSVGGGTQNGVYGNESTIGGGGRNYINGVISTNSTIGGGVRNGIISAYESTIGGGGDNIITTYNSTIGGGGGNNIGGNYGWQTIGGGKDNTINGNWVNSIATGWGNIIGGNYTNTIGGGRENEISLIE